MRYSLPQKNHVTVDIDKDLKLRAKIKKNYRDKPLRMAGLGEQNNSSGLACT